MKKNTDELEFLDWFTKGLCYFHLNQNKEAVEAYTQALTFEPQNCQALTNKAISLLNLGQINKAFSYFRQALSQNPNIGPAWYNLGKYFLELENGMDWDLTLTLEPGTFERAQCCFSRFLSLVPNMGGQVVYLRREGGFVRLNALPSLSGGITEELSIDQILSGDFPDIQKGKRR